MSQSIRDALVWWVDAWPKIRHTIQSHEPLDYCSCTGCHAQRCWSAHKDILDLAVTAPRDARALAIKFADHVMAEGVRFPAWIEKCGADAVRVALQEWFEEQLK